MGIGVGIFLFVREGKTETTRAAVGACIEVKSASATDADTAQIDCNDPKAAYIVTETGGSDISCDESHSQYFLVTPKLLTGLKYHPRMKVHFIQSGDWMPADSKVLNPLQSLAIMRRLAVAT